MAHFDAPVPRSSLQGIRKYRRARARKTSRVIVSVASVIDGATSGPVVGSHSDGCSMPLTSASTIHEPTRWKGGKTGYTKREYLCEIGSNRRHGKIGIANTVPGSSTGRTENTEKVTFLGIFCFSFSSFRMKRGQYPCRDCFNLHRYYAGRKSYNLGRKTWAILKGMKFNLKSSDQFRSGTGPPSRRLLTVATRAPSLSQRQNMLLACIRTKGKGTR